MKEAYRKRRTTGMRKGMREPYVKDLASRGGPESCVGDPRGRSEALTGVHAGRVLSLENSIVQGADAVVGAEGNIAGGVIRESPGGPAWSENPRTCAISSCREPGDLALALTGW